MPKARAKITCEEALRTALRNGNAADVKKQLARGGVDVNKIDPKTRQTYLHLAITGKASAEGVELLLSAGAKPNLKDHRGNTPLHIAVEKQAVKCVTALLTGQADPNLQNGSGSTPLHVAITRRAIKCVEALLSGHADPNIKDAFDQTPLHIAVEEGAAEFVVTLLSQHANPNIQDYAGNTALHLSTAKPAKDTTRKSTTVDKVLVTWAPLDVTIKNKKGLSPLETAEQKGKTITAKLITARIKNNLELKYPVHEDPSNLRKKLHSAQRKLHDRNEEVRNLRQTVETEKQLRVADATREKKIQDELETQMREQRTDIEQANRKVQVFEEQLEEKDEKCQKLEEKLTTVQQVEEKLSRYAIDVDKPGYLLLGANHTFNDSDKDRDGTDKDVSSIIDVFRDHLNYKLRQKLDFTAKEMRDKLTEVSTGEKYRRYSCLVTVLLSHGNESGVAGVDGEYISRKEIITLLGSSEVWAGKPKLVIIQACRGGEGLTRVKMGEVEAVSYTSHSTDTDDAVEDSSAPIPITTDMIMAEATPQGFTAIRSPSKGSYFIQSFAKHVKESARICDILKILTLVTSDVVTTRERYKKVSLPTISHSTLRKLFFLA